MKGQIYKVLEDTRNAENLNRCELCGSPLCVTVAQTSSRYHISVYECSQCRAVSFVLFEIYQEND